jgi:3-deoxy-D-manno-octulosonic-acid transferase
VIRQLSARGVPVLIANGRISDRAFGRYLAARFFLRRLFRKVGAVSAQDERMRARFVALGASPDQVAVNGNLKYDWEPSPFQDEAAAGLKRALRLSAPSLFLAGSTHEGEEDALFGVYAAVRKENPRARLLVAPRHPERMASIEKCAFKHGLRLRRVTTSSYEALSDKNETDVWLLDQVGVLASLYECAEFVFVGGSLVDVGGHNLVEPAFYSKPILFGPHMQNFSLMALEFKAQGAALEVADARALREVWENGLRDPRELVRRHQGATQKNVDWILSYTGSQERSFARV